MRALVFDKEKEPWDSSRGFLKTEVPDPVLDEAADPKDASAVIIKIKYGGLCGTDRGIWNRAAFKEQILGTLESEKKTVRVLGHELFGEIVKTGSRAKELYDLGVGDAVACESHVVCNNCFQCMNGEKNVCTNEKILGITHDGGFAEYLKVPGHIVWKTDTSKIRPEVAAMQEPFGNAVHAVSRASVYGKTVLIVGLGPIGLFAVLVAKAQGAKKVIGVEPGELGREMAKSLGIDEVIVSGPAADFHHDQTVVDAVLGATDGLGADVALEMAGSNSALNTAIFSTRRGGEVILFGIKSQDFVLENYNTLIVRGITMHAVIGRQIWETWETTRRILEDPANGVEKKLWEVILAGGNGTIIPIEDYEQASFEAAMAKHPKLLIKFS